MISLLVKVKGTLTKMMLIVHLLKDQQGCQRTFQRGGTLGSRRCEKAWEQDLVSIGAPVLNLGEAGDFIRDPIEGVLGA